MVEGWHRKLEQVEERRQQEQGKRQPLVLVRAQLSVLVLVQQLQAQVQALWVWPVLQLALELVQLLLEQVRLV